MWVNCQPISIRLETAVSMLEENMVLALDDGISFQLPSTLTAPQAPSVEKTFLSHPMWFYESSK